MLVFRNTDFDPMVVFVEHSGSVGKALVWGSKGC